MKKTLIAAALAAAFAGPVFAEKFVDSAQVISARPVTERTPVNREECWSEQRRGYEERRITRQSDGAPVGAGTVLGAIAGGVIGHQVGSGRGNDAATVGGAIVGGLVGSQVGNTYNSQDVQRCREVRGHPQYWDVTYNFRGQQRYAQLTQPPGATITVNEVGEPRG